MRFLSSLILVAALAACAPQDGQPGSESPPTIDEPPASRRSAAAIVESFANAWRGEEEFHLGHPLTLGVWVDGEAYTVTLTDNGARFSAAEPAQFDWGFETDLDTLRRIDEGSLNALTAMGQARASDPAPMDVRVPDGFSEDEDVRGFYIPLTRQFWDREWPETIRFGEATSRRIHGANTTVLIYDEGLRTAWYQLKAGMHVNADPGDQVNDFDTAILITRGRFHGKIDGKERLFTEGETVVVPAGTRHEFYAGDDEYGEFVILMWGDAA